MVLLGLIGISYKQMMM
ncbi:hypothetical protein CCAN12_810183 [Capnocytophaga canimorsus]|uniref:Uncharacterized protein n=1 Tax=Capnocytophaga canimorsus TaxID=28188 RepID=A0A0B7HT37_9FLAO|nr:hypothetical protein CCAN12_810183 [Capnocytophaga canimorsus]